MAQAIVADHESANAFEDIPLSVFDGIRAGYDMFYGHTSHGSQIITGISMLSDESPDYAAFPYHEISDDLGHNGDTNWVQPTRNYLDAHPECNIAMWSWCGGCSDNTDEGIDIYLAAMEGLEAEYPGVQFIYMTGHLDWSGPDGPLYHNNNRIRDYCLAHDKILFDFADIEAYDPDGNWYPDETDSCNWCYDWCAAHECPGCSSCAHSHCFNCYRKGKAFWWLMARIDGWNPTGVGPDAPGAAARVTLNQNHPNPFNPATEISFSLREPGQVELSVHDIGGRVVASVFSGVLGEGRHSLSWDGQNDDGRKAASGVYFYRVASGQFSETRKMTLLK